MTTDIGNYVKKRSNLRSLRFIVK